MLWSKHSQILPRS